MNESLLLGCGNLGKIILNGFLKKNKKIIVLEKNKKVKELVEKETKKKINFTNDFKKLEKKSFNYILLCVKPKDSIDILKKVRVVLKKKTILISFVAGLRLKNIVSITRHKNVVRMMPNILIDVENSSTAVFSNKVSQQTINSIFRDFSFFGLFEFLKKEENINFFTSLFGGGPAYIFYFLECLTRLCKKNGLSNKTSKELVLSLLNGTSIFVQKKNLDFSQMIKKVTSKGGTTEQAMRILKENDKLFKLLSQSIEKGKEKSEKISEEFDKG